MRVRWTAPAASDLTHICDYTERHFGPAQACRTALAIYNSADSLRKLPLKGRQGRRAGTRELSIPKSPFLVIYRIRERVIEVIRVLHGAQKWP
ncbi:MAG TPA: type II toxin-antitoxin system RelE/ParE family toxin [Bryobacteraceae bacterium]|nr:type II toxin-antitoxin system RelE/ParE family toxin [Bryobacteraceae bacterium]